MKTLLIVALGGSLGAVARYLLSQGSKSWWGDSFPYGTLLVNVVGCLAIGILAGLGMSQLSPNMQKLVVVGILGSLTTFSTFGLDTMELFQQQPLLGLANVAANLLAGLAAVALGFWPVVSG
jgi:CrcB protein